ncbi:amino acid permease [Novipirellula artificiosorum]|uniref:Serine/threonine exchanger SteT n=1 Tax=Novipirellula artificiosorum TaxID=2528016 RepID=A0A5C6E0Q6_9BACT|nr:amino acid permease [Novipirellula artificiosorum]TWU42084.1 Serine/threonine exchanger SteT [Novipirellula artificiosorum]
MDSHSRHLTLLGATGVGVGAIVGGGILALAGTAFATTGPAAVVAFAVNGIIALLTALSLAELASKFPQSGGTYTFAKKAMSVEAAFAVGWVVWFASVVAAVLYAIGFSHFSLVMVTDLWQACCGEVPDWLVHPAVKTVGAIATTVLLSASLMLRSAGGGHFVNVGKVFVFGLLILAGVVAVARQSPAELSTAFDPFFTSGIGGLVQAMGYTFIALQGFDLIAAVGGEVREPTKTIPRAMILSLLIAVAIYVPLLLVITAVGTPPGQSIREAAVANPEGVIAVAAENFMGPSGYWLVIVAAVLSMFSALEANLFAASRIARAMAVDRTLPSQIASLSGPHKTPIRAIGVTAGLVSLILIVLPDVSAAGAASSLIFLITFAIGHLIAFLVRRRSHRRPPPFRTPMYPSVPVLGGACCLALAVFQGIAVPSAGMITIFWLGLGGVMFIALFRTRASVLDASNTAINPELHTLRGRTPLVLVPIANPQNALAMISLADALVPADIGRVLTQTIVVPPQDWTPQLDDQPIVRSQEVMREILHASANCGVHIESLTTISADPMREIARVAKLHRCESVLLGLSKINDVAQASHLESLLGELDANVVILRSRKDWKFAEVRRVLVPIAGRGGHEHLLALLLGSMQRSRMLEVTFLRVMSASTPSDEVRRAERDLQRLAGDLCEGSQVDVVLSSDAIAAVAHRCDEADVLILGVQRVGRRKKLFGDFTRALADRTDCPIIVMSRRG